MLEVLCGNKTVEKILIFLFVNGKCYGTQLHRLLKIPLTPIQKALLRLERGNLIISHYEGKTRLYEFNPAHPLLNELELLLKKTYTLLPANEKKEYYIGKDAYALQPGQQAHNLQVLLTFWNRLSKVRSLTFHAKNQSKDPHGWNGKGQGEVTLTKPTPHVLIFHEKGSWQGKRGDEVSFSNVFRWTLDREACLISLEHLRQGLDHPVFLFHLAPSSNQSLASVDSHLCGGDTYFGQIHVDRFSLRLNWRVIGPKKNEEIDYFYASELLSK